MPKNFYPDKPLVTYQKTTIDMKLVIPYIKSVEEDKEVKRSAYIIFRNESGNGSKGLNNNFVGAQADSGRWPTKFDPYITGVVPKTENGTNSPRLFVQFASWEDSVNFLLERIRDRGIYIGGYERKTTQKNVLDQISLKESYAKGYIKWPDIKGGKYVPSLEEERNILSIICLAVAYKRTWVKGVKDYLPTVSEVNSFLSMYRQSEKLFI